MSAHHSDESLATLLTFPCDFPIKIMGKNDDNFRHFVHECLTRQLGDRLLSTREQHSGGGKYTAITAVGRFDSQAAIDALYCELSANPLVVMAL